MPLEKDWATAIGNMHKNWWQDNWKQFWRYAHRNLHTELQVHHQILNHHITEYNMKTDKARQRMTYLQLSMTKTTSLIVTLDSAIFVDRIICENNTPTFNVTTFYVHSAVSFEPYCIHRRCNSPKNAICSIIIIMLCKLRLSSHSHSAKLPRMNKLKTSKAS